MRTKLKKIWRIEVRDKVRSAKIRVGCLQMKTQSSANMIGKRKYVKIKKIYQGLRQGVKYIKVQDIDQAVSEKCRV